MKLPADRLAAIGIVLIAVILRFYGLAEWSLNNDEIAEVRWSSGPFAEMIAQVRADAVHPPLDYVVQWLLGKGGVPEWVRRLPAVVSGVFTVAGFILLGRVWHSRAAGLFAGLLLAISPIHIRYSQEVRPYAMGIAFVVAALVSLEMFAAIRRRRWVALWFASVFLAGATLYLAGLVAAVATMTRLWVGRRDELQEPWRTLPIAVLAWTILYTPWLGVVLQAARAVAPSPPETLNRLWWEHRLHAFSTGPESFQPMTAGALIFWLAAVAGVAKTRKYPRLRTPAAWLIAGSALSVVILQLRPHFAHTPRYMLPAMIIGSLLAGAGFATWWLHGRLGRWGATIAIAIITLYTASTLQAYYREGRPEWRQIAEFVHARVEPGEKVILSNPWVTRNFGWYWERMPPQPITIQQFYTEPGTITGPAWVVTGQCRGREPLDDLELIRRFPTTELAEVRYLPPERILSTTSELCPE